MTLIWIKLIGVLCLVIGVLAHPCTAFAQGHIPCALVPAQASMDIPNPQPLLSTSSPMAWITQRAHSHQRAWQQSPALAAFDHSIGLTDMAFTSAFQLRVQVGVFPNGAACVRLSQIAVQFGITSNIVFIASELPQGSCAQTDVEMHENRHVHTHAEALGEVGALLQNDIATIAARGISVEDSSAPAAEAQIQIYIQQVLARRAQQFSAAIDAGDSAIDSPAEYTRTSMACNGQMAHILSQMLAPSPS